MKWKGNGKLSILQEGMRGNIVDPLEKKEQ